MASDHRDSIPLDTFNPTRARLGSDHDPDDDDDTHDDDDPLEERRGLIQGDSPLKIIPDDDLDSAIALVRKVVPETDDPTLPTLTVRVVVLGTLLCVLGAAISQLFFFKSNAPSFSTFFIILLSLPLGNLCARFLPAKLNHPAPFSKKEHVLVGILASSGASAAYAGEILSVQELYYHSDLGVVGGLLLLLTTQLIGFGLSGLTYRLLVRPTAMLWPSQLVTVSLYSTLHGTDDEHARETADRVSFFSWAFASIATWQFVPSVVFPTMTSVAVLCLVDNRNSILTTLGSGYDGFGILDLSFDWSVIGGTGALYTPWFAQMSYFAGLATNLWIVQPVLYFSNFWNARSFDSPVAAHLYNSTFGRLDVKEILNPDLSLNEPRYAAVGPLQLVPYFALSYGTSFAILTSAVSSVVLWHSHEIKSALFRSSSSSAASSANGKPGRTTRTGDARDSEERTGVEDADVHVQILEKSYANVPNTWYILTFVANCVGAAALLTFYPQLQLPVWGLVLAVLLAIVFLVPIGIISAITNTTIGLNVITEFIAGWIWSGQPLRRLFFASLSNDERGFVSYGLTLSTVVVCNSLANVAFKCYGYMTMLQSLDLTSDLKLGLYMKIPPRHLFLCQVYGTALGSIVNFTLIKGVIAAKRPYLDGSVLDPSQQWTGRRVEIFFSASVIFGLISPSRFFDGQYRSLYWGFLLGAILPIVPYVLYKRTGNRFFKRISVPLVLHGSIGPPQTPMNVLIGGATASFLSQFYALRYHPRWYDKYNYVLSSALDAGTSINALVVYLLGIGSFVTWWGNSAVDTEHCIPGS